MSLIQRIFLGGMALFFLTPFSVFAEPPREAQDLFADPDLYRRAMEENARLRPATIPSPVPIPASLSSAADRAREVEKIRAAMDAAMKLAEKIKAMESSRAGSADPVTFPIHLDCSKYTGAAREMCLKARVEPNEHERSHYLNSVCRQAYAEGRRGNCIHMGWDANGNAIMTWIDEPAGTIPGLIASNCTPSFFRSCHRYSTYFLQPGTPGPQKWDNVSYLFDEWGAYNVGGRERLDKALKGEKPDLMINIVEGPMDFVVIAASIAQYQQTTALANFQNQQFRDFIRKQIENSMAIVRQAYEAQAAGRAFVGQTGGHTRAIYEQFLRSPQAQLLRQMYGDAWFDRTFNIDF